MYGRKVKLRFLFVVLILITLTLTVFLILKSLEENVVYFQSPSEIKALSEVDKKKIRVGGMVKKDSLIISDQEIKFTEKIVSILKPNGIVRYFEPAVNNKFLDSLRWLTPVPGRPSKIQTKKFEKWKINDPHPERDNSSKHYEKIGKEYFKETKIVPIGSIERFYRILPKKYRAYRLL